MSQETSPALPLAWVERLFARFASMYGARFLDLWRDVDHAELKQAWAEELGGLSVAEIKRGLDACSSKTFPPTLPEFIQLCRPGLDAERAYFEAVEQMQKRPSGEDRWSHPAVFWTASRIGAFDLRNSTWSSIRNRWCAVFSDVMSAGVWPEIPPHREALPAPGGQTIDREEARKRAEAIKVHVKQGGGVSWAERIFEEYAAGRYGVEIGIRFAEDVLGRPRPLREAKRPSQSRVHLVDA